jgi:hypothetical protein
MPAKLAIHQGAQTVTDVFMGSAPSKLPRSANVRRVLGPSRIVLRPSLPWLASVCLFATAVAAAGVFPEPQEMQVAGAPFTLNEKVSIVIPAAAGQADRHLARFLSAELGSRYGLAVRQEAVARLPVGRPFVLMGTIANPLVKQYCEAHGLQVNDTSPGPEGYLLSVTPDAIVVAASDEPGAFHGLQSLRQLIESSPNGAHVPGVKIRDWPITKFRAVKLYLPGRDNVGFFKRFVRDYMALYKYNKLIIEMNGAMRLDRHPEINAGGLDFTRDMQLRRLLDPPGLWFHGTNASHYDVADGGVLEKDEVADLVRWAESNYIEVIPELPSLTHSYYLLSRHRELAEIPQEEWPDTYCPSLPAVYDLLFDVYDEYIEVMQPKMVHIGHDEWRMPWGVCPRCRNKDPRELYAKDVNKIYDYLKRKGIRTAMWSDHLLENVRGAKLSKPWWDAPGYDYKIPGSLSPDQVQKWIPKDILMFNWLWHYTDDPKFPPVTNEERLSDWGFEQVYGNFEAWIPDFHQRSQRPRIIGGAPSAWYAVTEFNFGKDLLADSTGCAELLWSGRERTAAERSEALHALVPDIRRNLSGSREPSATESVVPVDLAPYFNSDIPGIQASSWKGWRVSLGRLAFELAGADVHGKFALVVGSHGDDMNPYPLRSGSIPIGQDATSLVFLHALVRPAGYITGDNNTFDTQDSADLLGWYEIEYEDGLITTVPLRYRWNILDLKNEAGAVAYRADLVDRGEGAKFYAFEWTNPRLGKVIKEIRLNGSNRFTNSAGKVIPGNAVILAALSVVPRREIPKRQDPPFPK